MVISFSIYGNNPKYTVGLLKNIELAKKLFPNWNIYIYHDNSVPEEILGKCKKNATLINMTNSNIPGMFWRFLPKETFIVRDVDSRLSKRDVKFVNSWLKSSKELHIIKDHPDHLFHKILGGMWGLKKTKFNMEDSIKKYVLGKNFQTNVFMEDMNFLKDIIYPNFTKHFNIGLFAKDYIGKVYLEDDKIERPEQEKILKKIKILIKYLKGNIKKIIKSK